MKKHLRVMAFLISVVMLFTCLSAGLFSATASADTSDVFIGVSGYNEIDKDCYDTSFNAWGYFVYTQKVDLTKGVYFTIDGFTDVGSWVIFGFGKNMEEAVAPYSWSTTYDSTLKVRYENGTMICAEYIMSIAYDACTTDIGTAANKTHFFQAVPVMVEGAIAGYKIYIDGKPLNSEGLTINVDTFNELNNYNKTTQSFDGCYLWAHSNITPTIGLSFPTDDRYTGSTNDTFAYAENSKGNDDITLGWGGRANSTWQADLKSGVCFTLDDVTENDAEDFATIGFANDLWALRRANFTGTMNPSLRLNNINGKLAVSAFDGTAYGEYTELDIDFAGKHTVKAVASTAAEETVYSFYIDGCEISGPTMTEADFSALNNNSDGAYIGFYANTGAVIKDVYKAIPQDSPFVGNQFACEQTEAPYTLDLVAWYGAPVSTWSTDLTVGLSFNVDGLPADGSWVTIGLCGNYWTMVGDIWGKETDSQPTLFFRNEDGKLKVSVNKTGSGEWHVTSTELSVSDTHILSAKLVTVDGVNSYQFYIDDVLIDGGDVDFGGAFSISEESFNLLNGYNELTDTFDGAYVRFVANYNARVQDLAPAIKAPEGILGDTNNDGTVDANDLTVMRKYLLGISLEDVEFNAELADAHKDNTLDIRDLIALKKLAVKNI